MICPNCKGILLKGDGEYYCDNNHHFDIAKTGYVNLLLNQPKAGDNKSMVNARKLILNKGYFKPLLEHIITILKNHHVESLLDLGCGEGYYSRNIKKSLNIPIYGVDISKDAINAAAKQSSEVVYLVSNIYNLPFADQEVDTIINVFAPYSNEIKRVMNNLYIKVIPGPKHLLELKEALYKEVYIKEEEDHLISELNLISEEVLSYQVFIEETNALLQMTPYFYKSDLDNINVKGMDVSMDFRIIIYKK